MRFGFLAIFCLLGSASLTSGALIVNPAISITHTVTINPIVVSDSGGSPTAVFFGTESQQAEIEGFVDTIMAQVGIDVDWLDRKDYTNAFLYDSATALGQYAAVTPDTIESTVPEIVNMWFVAKVPGAAAPGPNSVNGLAFVDDEGLAISVGSSLATFTAGREAIGAVVAHELSHNLGLDHIVESENLMEAFFTAERLTASQLTTIMDDAAGFDGYDLLVAVVPEPSTGILSGLALFTLMFRRRRSS